MQETVQQILRGKLNIGTVKLERAHQVGPRPPPGDARPRTVVVRFTNSNQQQQALRNSARLKNTNIYINEDLCESSVQIRKEQLPTLKRTKAEGKIAYFNYTKLVVRERGAARVSSVAGVRDRGEEIVVSDGGGAGSGAAISADATVPVAAAPAAGAAAVVVGKAAASAENCAVSAAGIAVSTRYKDSRDTSNPRNTRQRQGRVYTK
ncbi:hypothetical protein Pcinc_016989 [Petrolisthes cinctipes]|uniref:Uncharacterized protein n=1 Tax=Petrolisthes cinctipes TaxID=88211 RepID=A0AAE1FRQ5_PETCI|nr:hypothetical protein Pcinc_016989 [Petrolisthes cinctipes]